MKLSFSILVALVSLFIQAPAQAQQFKEGVQFSSVPIYGNVFITCHDASNGQWNSAHYTCNDLRLSPVEYDYFMGPQGVNADKVKLTSTQANGKKVAKNVNYENGRTSSRVNLWIRTLLQTPLLSEGLNKINYQMTLRNAVVAEGAFDIDVQRTQAKQCPNGNITSNIASDCQSPYSACQLYFSRYNYCQ